MIDRDLELRLEKIEGRLRLIENRLGILVPPERQASPATPPPIPLTAVEAPSEAGVELPAREDVVAKMLQLKHPAAHAALAPVPPEVQYEPRPEPQLAPRKPGEIEQTIGLKWAGWIGAVVLVIGAAFGVRYAYDQQWFGFIPKWIWLGLIYVAGFALLAAGEIVRRKVHDIPAASLFGAGIATLFLGGYVGHSYYELYDHRVALMLMIFSTLVGAFVALRGNLVSIAALSLIGGNLTPLLVGDHGAPIVQFLTYLLMLQLIAVVLSYLGRGGKWWTLRGLSLASGAGWMMMIFGGAHGMELSPIVFSCVFAALYHCELVLSARRAPMEADAPRAIGDVPGVTFAGAVTGALTLALLRYFGWSASLNAAIAVLALAGISCIFGFALPRVFGPRLRPLATTHRIAAAALAVVAVPIATTGLAVEIAWGAMSLVFAVIWLATSSRISRLAAPVTWSLTALHLTGRIFADLASHASPSHVWVTVFDTPISQLAAIAWILALLGQLIAWTIGRGQTSRSRAWAEGSVALSVAATALAIIAAVIYLPPAAASLAMIIAVWLLIGLSVVAPDLRTREQAVATVAITAAKWLVFDTFLQRFAEGWSATQYSVLLNPLTGVGALLALSLVMLRRLNSAHGQFEQRLHRWIGTLLLLIVAWVGTMEIDRAVNQFGSTTATFGSPLAVETYLFTAWWAALLVGALMYPRTKPAGSGRAVQVISSLLTLLAIKFMILDCAIAIFFAGSRAWPPISNPHALAGAVMIAAFVVVTSMKELPGSWRNRAGVLLMLLVLWSGTAELHRVFNTRTMLTLADPRFAEQVGLSIFWAIYAVAAIAAGFMLRTRSVRYFGLTLLALTLLKLVIVDLQHVATGYRILSFIGVGIVMLATSVIYGKVSPNVMARTAA